MGPGYKRILVVDDDADIRELICMILDMEGYSVNSLDNGHEVLSMVQSYKPHVVLLDVMLGDTDGRDICKMLKQADQTKDIPIIMVSATHGRHTMSEKQCGANDYVSKPFNVDDLVSRVGSYFP